MKTAGLGQPPVGRAEVLLVACSRRECPGQLAQRHPSGTGTPSSLPSHPFFQGESSEWSGTRALKLDTRG